MAKRDFAFGKENFILIAVAVAEIFSTRRIVVAPVVTVIGFGLMIVGILKNSKGKEIAE